MIFGRKPPPISKDRLAAVVGGGTNDQDGARRPKIPMPRSDRQSTWSRCVLVWEPASREEGICLDISETGARIRFTHKVYLPDRFNFVSSKLGINVPAAFVRHDLYDVIIRFIT